MYRRHYFGRHIKPYVDALIDRSWMPGAGFKIKARHWRNAVMEMRDAPFESVLKALVCSHVNTIISGFRFDLRCCRNLELPGLASSRIS